MSLVLAAGLAACSARAERPVRERAPAAVDPADVAADQLQQLVALDDGERCAAEGEALVARHPESGRLRARWIACVSRVGRHLEAAGLATQMMSQRPGDPWAEWARVAVWLGESTPARVEALARSQALVDALDGHPAALRLRAATLVAWDRADELAQLVAAHPRVPAWARVHLRLRRARDGDATQVPLALADAHAVAPDDPEFVTLTVIAGRALEQLFLPVDALAWADAGLARAPDSLRLRTLRWRLLQQVPEAGKQAVLEDISLALARGGERPALLLAASEAYRGLGEAARAEAIERRIADEHADSPAAEALLARASEALGPGPAQRAADAAFLGRPRHHDPRLREAAALRQFTAALADPAATAAQVVAAIEATRPLLHGPALEFFTAGAQALVERESELALAEALVREGLAAVSGHVAVAQAIGHDFPGMYEWGEGRLYDLLARVHLAAGRVVEAQAALREATARGSVSDDHAIALAEVARRRGDAAAADVQLVACSDEYDGDAFDDACRRALVAVWKREHGDLRGLDAHVAKLLVRTREQRRQQVFRKIAAAPRTAPEFRFTRFDGEVVSSESTRGKFVVLHFWFTACEPCVAELPRWQQFVDAHAGQRDLVILSVHILETREVVEAWMAEHGYRFAVAMGTDWWQSAGLRSFPSTWFLDRQGRIAFETGGLPDLPLEFAWRVEAMRAAAHG
ncbi:TlpA disulfide reductase family protein [Nannocystis radixulma]|uniref:TlpA disulfide reductase family protein n=1 Tax=Nannocystis radixulma TaxID=2995305 RepID=A0ABT5BFN5_9BACT|nr:TlpA disulfide reductase family protein [Nannocystis radixulma]MDC0672962.1 TlpA disulfide reductase family protein [Nannocystis radixulma]